MYVFLVQPILRVHPQKKVSVAHFPMSLYFVIEKSKLVEKKKRNDANDSGFAEATTDSSLFPVAAKTSWPCGECSATAYQPSTPQNSPQAPEP